MIIGIRKEDKGHWEKRAPLAPRDIQRLRDAGISVIVESSDIRAYSDAAYSESGAVIKDNISDADIILGVKEIPLEKFAAGKTYMFFSI